MLPLHPQNLGTHSVLSTAGIAQLVECQPSKLNVASSSLVARSIRCRHSSVVERILGKDEVPSSTLGDGSYLYKQQYKQFKYNYYYGKGTI